MYLVFIDESGNSKIPRGEEKNPTNGTTLYLTFAGVIVDMACMHDIEYEIQKLKNKFFIDRLTEAKFSRKNTLFKEDVNVHEYRREYAELITKFDLTIVGVCINKYTAAKTEESQCGMYKLGFQTLLQSLRDFQSYHSFSELTLIVDSIGKNHDRDVLVAYQKALQSFDGHPGFYRKRFSPTIIFADSEFTCGLQVVDYCAASIQRSVEADDPTYASIIKPKLFANEKGIQYGYGFKWIPEK